MFGETGFNSDSIDINGQSEQDKSGLLLTWNDTDLKNVISVLVKAILKTFLQLSIWHYVEFNDYLKV